jgi:hypothetical protein
MSLLLALVLAASPFKAELIAPTHTPKVDAKWYYTIRATRGGKPIPATVTVMIDDPFGGSHPATYDNTSKPLVNWPFRGVFRDYAQWPAEATHFKLTFRAVVKAGGSSVTLTYWVKAR